MSLLVLGVFVATGLVFLGNENSKNDTSALTYKTKEDIYFTFSPMISINVSSSTIDIPTLAPGTTAESDPITVTVATNTAYGYSLYADVGNNTDYNTDSLVHSSNDNSSDSSNNSTPSVFTSIATNASLPQLTTDNTWGYSYKPSTESTWSTYNGLPLYTTTEDHTSTTNPALLIDTKDPGDSSRSIDFKIAARASSTQPSGTYSNVINFYAVGKPKPMTIEDLTYMQDFKSLSATDKETVFQYMLTGKQYKLIDNRDGNTYWLAKQADGNIWMTQNLDLCIGCEGTTTLTSQNTDLNESGSDVYTDGYTNVGGVITWTPASTAVTSSHPISGTRVSGWRDKETAPYSAENGGRYIYTSNTLDSDSMYNSMADCIAAGNFSDDCEHYHTGNYYNWTAAIASNASSSLFSDYDVAANSVCPAGWKIPQIASSEGEVINEFQNLFYDSGVITSIDSDSYTENGFDKARTFPLYYTRAGFVGIDTLKEAGRNGYYPSAITKNTGTVYSLEYSSSELLSTDWGFRVSGFPIRCLVR